MVKYTEQSTNSTTSTTIQKQVTIGGKTTMSNIQFSSGNSVGVSTSRRMTIINGKEYPFAKGMKGYSITTINGKTYIDGYELVNGQWKRTLKGFFHLFF